MFTFFYVMLVRTYVLCIEITVRFDNATYISDENTGVVKPLLVLSNPSSLVETAQVINIDITTGTMYAQFIGYTFTINILGQDYSSGPYAVSFPIGFTNVSFDIMINDDNIMEDDEMFNISIISITNGHIVGNPGVATVTIVDNTLASK